MFCLNDFGTCVEKCLQPRHYPVQFGEAIVKIREDLANSRASRFPPDPLPSGHDIVARMGPDQEGLFVNANFLPVIKYLRYGSGLKLPQRWKEILPRP